MTAELYW